jgi:hypothetical protein
LNSFERGGFELDVVERQRVGERTEDRLAPDREVRTVGLDREEYTVEAVVRAARRAVAVRRLDVVPVVERPHVDLLPGAGHHVLDPLAVTLVQQLEGIAQDPERVVTAVGEMQPRRHQFEALTAAFPHHVGEVEDQPDQQQPEDDQDHRRHAAASGLEGRRAAEVGRRLRAVLPRQETGKRGDRADRVIVR